MKSTRKSMKDAEEKEVHEREDTRTDDEESRVRGAEEGREIKTQKERNEGDQRHVEFTITLLDCTVIKARSPRRERRLQACPVSSPAPLISSVSPTETYRQTFRKGSFYCTGSLIGSKESARQAQIVMARAPLNLEEGGLSWMSCCQDLGEAF